MTIILVEHYGIVAKSTPQIVSLNYGFSVKSLLLYLSEQMRYTKKQ